MNILRTKTRSFQTQILKGLRKRILWKGKLIDDIEWEEIAVETNRYADQVFAAKQPLLPYSGSRDHAVHSHNHSHGHRQPDQHHRLLVKTQFLERLTARHFPSKIPNDRKSKSLQCVVCNPAVAQMLASQGLPKKHRP
ncbi:hypothetical protein DPMN_044131, partial [Dreissena polymorpha]